MAYIDTTMAQIRRVSQLSLQELEIELSEAIQSLEYVEIVDPESEAELTILRRFLNRDRLYLLTAKPDTLSYTIRMRNMVDEKGNQSPLSGLNYKPKQSISDAPLRLLSISPRNGATVSSLQPEITLEFSRIVSPDNLKLSLLASDDNAEAEWEIVQNMGRNITIRPTEKLSNYRSYQILIEKDTQDFAGNTLESNRESVFLPIKR
jgi:methionine-rich copper-binding protein CopC